MLADERQAGLLDLGGGVSDGAVGERVEERLAFGDGHGGEDLRDVEEGGGGAEGDGRAGCGGAGVVLGAAAEGYVGEGAGGGGEGRGAWDWC